jgi:hypothetical protein
MMRQLLPHAGCVELLCAVPAAAQLSSEAAARLLLEGLKQGQHVAVAQLVTLAGAQQISSELIAELLIGCAQVYTDDGGPSDECLETICKLPAAIALSSTEFIQLLAAVFERGFGMQHYDDDSTARINNSFFVFELFCMPASRLSTEQVMQLILETVVYDSAVAYDSPCLYLRAGELSSEMLLQSLQAVVEAGRGACTVNLCSLPKAQQFGSGAVAQLLQAAADPMCIASLCQLPAARELSCEAVAELLATVVKQDEQGTFGKPSKGHLGRIRCDVMSALELHAAKALCGAMVVQLLHTAAEHGNTACTKALCKLPGAAQISRAAVARLLQTSLQLGHHECTQQMCMLPAAQSFSREQVLEVFEMAVQHKCDATIRILCKELPAAAQLSTEMSAAMHRLQKEVHGRSSE